MQEFPSQSLHQTLHYNPKSSHVPQHANRTTAKRKSVKRSMRRLLFIMVHLLERELAYPFHRMDSLVHNPCKIRIPSSRTAVHLVSLVWLLRRFSFLLWFHNNVMRNFEHLLKRFLGTLLVQFALR